MNTGVFNHSEVEEQINIAYNVPEINNIQNLNQENNHVIRINPIAIDDMRENAGSMEENFSINNNLEME